jgi:polysaccharide pyruvyl transferase WcaK-like protein
LHGTVLSLKNGVPVIAVDAISGGAKVTAQAQTIGWPHCYSVDSLDATALEQAFDACLTEAARAQARACAERAKATLDRMRRAFLSRLDA